MIEESEVIVSEWVGCYSGGWKSVICDAAFSHPAKVAFNLAKRIYEHAIDEKWIAPGDVVVDPFGGIGGCVFHGLVNGMRVVTCEIEEKFVNLSKENRELWREKFTGLPGFDADNWIILQGDSRKLTSVIREAGIAVSSPPYSTGCQQVGTEHHPERMESMYVPSAVYGEAEGQLGAMKEGDLRCAISSPPYAANEKSDYLMTDDGKTRRRDVKRGFKQGHGSFRCSESYGDSEGQLGRMRDKDGSFIAAVSSPPFPQPYTGGGGINKKGYGDGSDKVGGRTYQSQGGDRAEGNLETLKDGGFDVVISSPPYAGIRQDGGKIAKEGQGGITPYSDDPVDAWFTTRDQTNLGNMRDDEKGFSAAISSPPYEGTKGHPSLGHPELDPTGGNILKRATTGDQSGNEFYGQSEGQIQKDGDTFWSASRTILEQLYSILTPGAHAIFIVKAFVRNKQIVDFPGQWAQLCEAVGFKLIHDHHAMLTEHSGTQGGMFGEDKEYKTKRVSFFRRLHERRSPETELFYENVLCFLRP